jgi:hypothetical protein
MFTTNDERNNNIAITFDKYIYKKMVDLCMEFFNIYGEQIPGRNGLPISWKLARKFQVILDFCLECESLPDYFKHPPLQKWNMSETKGLIHIHPRLANKFVMRLLNEIKRQEANILLTAKELDEQLEGPNDNR